MLFLFEAVASQVIFLIAMVLTQSSTGQKEGGRLPGQYTRTSLLSRDKTFIFSNNLYLLWAKAGKRYNSEVFPFSCEYKIPLTEWNVFKHLL